MLEAQQNTQANHEFLILDHGKGLRVLVMRGSLCTGPTSDRSGVTAKSCLSTPERVQKSFSSSHKLERGIANTKALS